MPIPEEHELTRHLRVGVGILRCLGVPAEEAARALPGLGQGPRELPVPAGRAVLPQGLSCATVRALRAGTGTHRAVGHCTSLSQCRNSGNMHCCS